MERTPSNRQPEEQNHFDEWEKEFSGDPPLAQEASRDTLNQRETSPTAALLRRATERIANVANTLDNRAATRGERSEARTETIAYARETIYAIGRTARRTSKEIAYTGVALTFIAAEATSQGIANTRDKLVAVGASAKERFQKRIEHRRMLQEAYAMNERHDEHTEALAMNQRFDQETEALAMNEQYDQQAEAERMHQHFDEHTEALAMNEAYDNEKFYENAREVAARAAAARARKEARRERWDERIGKVREKGGNFWKYVKSKSKSIGRGALKAMRRGRAAVRGARQGWKQAA